MPKKLTPEEFSKKSNDKFGDKFKIITEYVSYEKNIIISCKEHGNFNTTPKIHLKGAGGCPKCSGNTKQTTENFIERSKKIYGDTFNYTNTNYTGINNKVIITCKIHGDFEQFVKPHLNGSGCTKCSGRAKHTTESFIEASVKKHGNVYDYSKTAYGKNNKQQVTIICPTHGEFEQIPNSHLSGKGCVKCSNEALYSKAVNEILNYFKQHDIEYELEKTFPDCKNILSLRYDFYIPSINTCIEYDGLQHFESCGWGGEDKLKLTQENDKIKNEYCENNNIGLVRIKYNEDHIKILKRIFNDRA
ncbi:HNH endonuclease [Cronobacter phage vB_CsaM_GAP32]|uniref:Homing endonuclease n=1 Tax=Cronobacter phage vB_CsaM_GAP32 TaxID=1141136 RepID=K4FB49_9CAUD|nr:HNH endonuclease [Cronobacter phage vB_CsaM_GAP32]AFC21724.1 hypothetical protein GAP32_274 [Cronobacter phage vB_CsaM_GAP32]